ncbi:MAG: hypothetical protein JO303_03670 [Caulobacteraceae bacterium]|nr:hypothetical protein [Caulobacteraceae bacterium]
MKICRRATTLFAAAGVCALFSAGVTANWVLTAMSSGPAQVLIMALMAPALWALPVVLLKAALEKGAGPSASPHGRRLSDVVVLERPGLSAAARRPKLETPADEVVVARERASKFG